MVNIKARRRSRAITEGVFTGVVIALNIDVMVRGNGIDRGDLQVPPWADVCFILADVLASYLWARLLIWLFRQVGRGVRRLWSGRSDSA